MNEIVEELTDRGVIERWLRRDAPVHLYELGDLDDFFFPHTRWFALHQKDDSEITALALLYVANPELPVLLIMGREHEREREAALTLLKKLANEDRLPRRFYAHLVPKIAANVFEPHTTMECHGRHDRMVLRDWSKVEAIDITGAELLTPRHREELLRFYAGAYPGNWFDARMLETGTYFGVRDESSGKLASVAGVHVVSRKHRVASLGNIATDPAMRGKGLGAIATAAVVRNLGREIDPLGLNVESANETAIRMYARLGFEYVTSYDEVLVTR